MLWVVRIVLHAGLHKSATTFTQSFWAQVYGEPGDTWYPVREGQGPSGHQYLFRPFLRAFTLGDDPDLVLASLTARPESETLVDVVARAEQEGVQTLLLSSEDLDRVQQADLPDLLAALGAHETTLLLTVTRPVHRWCANWQTMVRRGLSESPRGAARQIERVAALTPGRLEELARWFPASRRVVRIVETDPPEPDLPRDLARILGLPDPGSQPQALSRNVSLGVDIEVLRRMNQADLSIGTFRGGAARLAALRGDGFTYRDVEGLAADYALSETCWEAARVEQELLARPPADLETEVHDPHDLLARWLDPTPPPWYVQVSQQEAVVAELDDLPDTGEQYWRVRQERSAYQALLDKAEQQVKRVLRRTKKQAARIADLEQQVRDLGGDPERAPGGRTRITRLRP